MSSQAKLKVKFPDILAPLFSPMRYKVLYGGRGGVKSWGVAKALLIQGSNKPLRILCARELQKSIKDSVHRLLKDQIFSMGLGKFYEVKEATIRGKNGTEFFFEGLRHNTNQIKSYEGIDIVWIEEAATVSKSSWDVLIPTIRKDDSEIWLTFNPELEEDETYQRFVENPPDDAWVQKLNWRDNPWFPEVLRKEKETLKKKDHNAYLNVWEGECKVAIEGAIYQDELIDAKNEDRICHVPLTPDKLVNVFFDLGFSDHLTMWFIQKVGFEWRIIDYHQDTRKKVPHYALLLRNKNYAYGKLYLPHDGAAESLGSEKTIEEQFIALGFEVEIVQKLSIADGINAVRTVFPVCYFDKEKCSDGLTSLRRYRYKTDPDTGRVEKKPHHDQYSHGADGFRYFAVTPHIMTEAYLGTGEGKMDSEFDPYR